MSNFLILLSCVCYGHDALYKPYRMGSHSQGVYWWIMLGGFPLRYWEG